MAKIRHTIEYRYLQLIEFMKTERLILDVSNFLNLGYVQTNRILENLVCIGLAKKRKVLSYTGHNKWISKYMIIQPEKPNYNKLLTTKW